MAELLESDRIGLHMVIEVWEMRMLSKFCEDVSGFLLLMITFFYHGPPTLSLAQSLCGKGMTS